MAKTIIVPLEGTAHGFDDFFEAMEYMELYEGANRVAEWVTVFPDYPMADVAPVGADVMYVACHGSEA